MFQIPMLLGDSSEHILNDSADNLMQDSSLHQDLLDPYPGLDELGDVDPMQWGPEAFPNLTSLPEESGGVLRYFVYVNTHSHLAESVLTYSKYIL